MSDKFSEITSLKGIYDTDSENTPLEFYIKVIPSSKEIKMNLGYFSSYAFSLLSYPMAKFIYNGGIIKIITNHELNKNDFNNLIDNKENFQLDFIEPYFQNVDDIVKNLNHRSQHFFDCLKFLIQKGRLDIQPVRKINSGDSHRKNMVFFDGEEKIATNGSMNFTLNGLAKNGENFNVDGSWQGKGSQEKISAIENVFDLIFSGKHEKYEMLDKNKLFEIIEKIGNKKTQDELIIDSIKLEDIFSNNKRLKSLIDNLKEELNKMEIKDFDQLNPEFPHEEPYQYQKEANSNWIKNSFSGLFEMATGTGKTLTAILCLVDEFKRNGLQKNIIVVPGEELVQQWAKELNDSNFSNIFKWSSKNKNLTKEIDEIKFLRRSNCINIVITYESFQLERFSKLFSKNFEDFIVVFDEAHHMGALGFMNTVKTYKFKKTIGLSATPLRDWDENESNKFIYSFFNLETPTFVYPLEKAIGKFLCEYDYHPYFAELSEEEWKDYKYWTKKLWVNPEESKINATAANKRQLIIDQCDSKVQAVLKIIEHLIYINEYKYTLVYCPKGKDDDEERIIKMIGKKVADKFKETINGQFFLGETKDRDLLLDEFSCGEIDLIYAIKCLDEGVNIPITKNAIFIASGKNKREYIQRRGRVLRLHDDKELSNIYDIITLPSYDSFLSDEKTAINLIKAEFSRIIEFIETSRVITKNIAKKIIDDRLNIYNLNFHNLKNLIEQDEKARDN